MPRIGFIGFGEAATAFAGAMVAKGADVGAYDLRIKDANCDDIKRRAESKGVALEGLAELFSGRQVIISTVTTDVAYDVAVQCVPYLKPNNIYVDMNSTSPKIKESIAEVIGRTGAKFIEGAILGAIGATGAATKVLLGGKDSQSTAQLLNGYGLNTVKFSDEIGKASTFKMVRSVFSKGAEALLIEMLVVGRKAGIEKQLWDDIMGFMEAKPFSKIASNWLETHATACERRYFEMKQVCQTLEEIGANPVMSCATEQVFKVSVDKGLKEKFTSRAENYEKVIDAITGTEAQGVGK